jgi:hypothetical protein
MIDLHVHTTASDGQYGPEELVRRAFEAGVDTLSITDHDTVAAIAEAEQAAARLGVRLIPGIELSTFLGEREVHVLGHFLDPSEPGLKGFSSLLHEGREERMGRMITRLRALGLLVEMQDVRRVSSGKNLGRPHLARAMIEHGYARDVKDAFDRFLAVGGPGYVERFKLTSADAIALIRRAGGAATVAHPHMSGLTREELVSLRREGLAGIEVDHSDQSAEVREELAALARALDLVPTAGSDFHGEIVAPGRRLGTTTMERTDLARLEARAERSLEAAHERG